jgi:hypothetical protein
MGQVLGCQDERSDRKSSMMGVEQEFECVQLLSF